MALGTFDSTPPPLFKHGPSELSKLLVYGAFAILLVVVDQEFQVARVIRSVVATAMTPVQVLASMPTKIYSFSAQYLEDLEKAQVERNQAQQALLDNIIRASQAEHLKIENTKLRQLLELKPLVGTQSQPAEVLYDARDPYSRKVIINKGSLDNIALGSPVVAIAGVLGQVTRVHPRNSEVTLLSQRDHPTPVVNVRTGVRSVAYGLSSITGDTMELRFIAANADVAVGDTLTTSGIDGIYPSSLLVAKVEFIERRADSGFAKIRCKPLANAMAVRHVLVLKPISNPQQDLAEDEAEAIAEANALNVASAASSASSSHLKKGAHK